MKKTHELFEAMEILFHTRCRVARDADAWVLVEGCYMKVISELGLTLKVVLYIEMRWFVPRA